MLIGGDHQLLNSTKQQWHVWAVSQQLVHHQGFSGCCRDDLCSHLYGPFGLPFSLLFPGHSWVARNYSAALIPYCGLCRYALQLFVLWHNDASQYFTRTIDCKPPLLLNLCSQTYPGGCCHLFRTWPKEWLRVCYWCISHCFLSGTISVTKIGEYFSSLVLKMGFGKAGKFLLTHTA